MFGHASRWGEGKRVVVCVCVFRVWVCGFAACGQAGEKSDSLLIIIWNGYAANLNWSTSPSNKSAPRNNVAVLLFVATALAPFPERCPTLSLKNTVIYVVNLGLRDN